MMIMSTIANTPRRVLWRLAAACLLTVIMIGLSCARQQDEVLAQPKEPATQQSEQQK